MSSDPLKNSMDEILRVVTDVEIIIAERLFVQKYLPLFMDKNKLSEFVKEWLVVCKNPYYPVKIVNDMGDFLFEVPPLLLRQPTRVVNDERYSYSEIIERTRLKRQVFPKQGDRFFNECMKKIKVEGETKYAGVWESICKKYGYIDNVTSTDDETDSHIEEMVYEDI